MGQSELMLESCGAVVRRREDDARYTYPAFFSNQYTAFFHAVIRRALDIVVAGGGLCLLALLLPFIALVMLYEDGGPLFYRQVRVGYRGRPFVIYKIRSMVADADRYLARHPQLRAEWERMGKLKDDPRVTKLGALLRRSSLDELPQMLNILKGEMSLVGPRAIQFSEQAAFGNLIELRQAVRPGLTGLWQICGRSTTDYEQRGLLDCTYVLQRSLWLDLYILARTLPAVWHGMGAY
jgi:exopolysaccharide production protein ExoY